MLLVWRQQKHPARKNLPQKFQYFHLGDHGLTWNNSAKHKPNVVVGVDSSTAMVVMTMVVLIVTAVVIDIFAVAAFLHLLLFTFYA